MATSMSAGNIKALSQKLRLEIDHKRKRLDGINLTTVMRGH